MREITEVTGEEPNTEHWEQSPRITADDARAIIKRYFQGAEKSSDDGDITYWLKHEGGLDFIHRLNNK